MSLMEKSTSAKKISSREVFLHLFLFVTLYLSFYSLGHVLFVFIELPRAGALFLFDPVAADIRYDIAVLLVMFPAFCGTACYIIKQEIPVFRLLAMLSFFLTGLIVVSTLACVMYYFLQAGVTAQFLLKVVTVLGISALVFYYYYWDLKYSWNAWSLIGFFGVTSFLMMASIIYGFYLTGAPWKLKALIADREKTALLYNVQDNIVVYWLEKKELPDSLAQAEEHRGTTLEVIEAKLSYKKISNLKFKLCATFLLPSIPGHGLGSAVSSSNPHGERMLDSRYPDSVLYDFEHAQGDVCFTRVLKPELIRH